MSPAVAFSTRLCAFAATGLLSLGGLAACSEDSSSETGPAESGFTRAGKGGKVGVILPDTSSSQRWGSDDPKLLKKAFDAAGVPVDIQNANGDEKRFVQIAEDMIADGTSVMMITSLGAESARTVHRKARDAGVKTIDYDRLSLNADADYYVSFDNRAVGELQGQGLINCLKDSAAAKPVIADLNGAPDDNNATLFKAGYESVLQEKYDSGAFLKGPDQSIEGWKTETATAIFREMWVQTNGKIDGVLAANDGLAAGAIAVLTQSNRNGKVPVTGQDATVQGLQNILAGDQCMTVYKPIKEEADAAAAVAIALYKGETPDAPQQEKDPESGAYVPAKLLKPQAVTKKDVGRVISEGFAARSAVCAGRFKAACAEAGI
jgi:D-xylose transport system substrate-binding protein